MNTQALEKTPETCRFDWYSATITDQPQRIAETLESELETTVKITRGMHGYTTGFEFEKDTVTVARMLAGGPNGRPTVWASGEDTGPFVDLVRNMWPETHYVTRMDSAVDFDGQDVWDRLEALALATAEKMRLKTRVVGDYHGRTDGVTLYLGAVSSPAQMRLYEKGKQMRLRMPVELRSTVSENWVRAEIQLRPQKHARVSAASASPVDAWGYAAFAKHFAAEALNLDVERVAGKVWRETDDERAYRFAVKQYGAVLHRQAEKLGSWEGLGLDLRDVIAKERLMRGAL